MCICNSHKKNPTRCNSVSKFISYLCEAHHVSGDTPPIIRSLKLHSQPLVLHTWRAVGRVVAGHWQRPATTRPTTLHVCKTRGCEWSFRLLMMGGMSPETCWASYKYEINVDTLLHVVAFFMWINTMMHGSTNIKFTNVYLMCRCANSGFYLRFVFVSWTAFRCEIRRNTLW